MKKAKTMSEQFTDEELMAYADGTCAPEDARRIATAAIANKAMAARIAMFKSTARMVKQAMPPVADAARDDALAAMIRNMAKEAAPAKTPDNVVQFPRREKPRQVWWQQAAAAAAVLLVVLAGSYLVSTPMSTPGGAVVALAPEVESILQSLPSGAVAKTSQGEIALIASFKDNKGHFCREYEVAKAGQGKVVSIACTTDKGWRTMMLATLPAEGDSFTPAGGAQAIETYLQSAGMTEPLTTEEEKALLMKP